MEKRKFPKNDSKNKNTLVRRSIGASSAGFLIQDAMATAAMPKRIQANKKTGMTATRGLHRATYTPTRPAEAARRRDRAAERASAAADEAERMALNQYQAGRLGYSDVIVSQVAALNARRQLAQVIADRQTSAVALIQALGGGWSSPRR